MSDTSTFAVAISLCFALAGFVFFVLRSRYSARSRSAQAAAHRGDGSSAERVADAATAVSSAAKRKGKASASAVHESGGDIVLRAAEAHAWHWRTIKNHTDNVACLVTLPGGVLTSAEDRQCRLFFDRTFGESQIKSVSFKIPQDHLATMRLAWDGTTLVGATAASREVALYTLALDLAVPSAKATLLRRFATGHRHDVIAAGMACAAAKTPVVITLARDQDTVGRVFDSRTGEQLHSFDTRQVRHNSGAVSPDGRFFVATSFMSDVKVFEARSDRAGGWGGLELAINLGKHRAEVLCCSWAADSLTLATGSRDGVVIVWGLGVRFAEREDARVVMQLQTPGLVSRLALAPDASALVACCGASFRVFSIPAGELLGAVDAAHGSAIGGVAWAPNASYFVTHAEEKIVHVWRRPGSS